MRSAFFCGVACIAGCSLLVPLDASSGGGDPAAAGGDGATMDGADVATTDATTESSADGGSESRALNCPTAALLCDDFERNDLGGGGRWKVENISLSTALAHSPTRSVTLASPDNSYRAIEHTFDTAPLHVRISFRLHAGAAPPGYVEVMKIPYGPPFQWDTAALGIDDDGLGVGLQTYTGGSAPAGSNGITVAAPSKIFGAGFRLVVVDIDFQQTLKVIVVSVDGAAPMSMALDGHTPTQGPANLMFGALYRNADGATSDTFIDDVVVEAL